MNMKMLFFTLLAICTFFTFQSCGNKPDDENPEEQKPVPLGVSDNSGSFNSSFSKLLSAYFSLKDAFIAADMSKAGSAAMQLATSADSINFNEVQGDSSGTIRETAQYFASAISASAKAVASQEAKEERLREFNTITDAMWSLTRTVQYSGSKIYYQYCPAAFDNTGGYWLSEKIEDQNPYLGPGSAKCGQVTDSLDYSRK